MTGVELKSEMLKLNSLAHHLLSNPKEYTVSEASSALLTSTRELSVLEALETIREREPNVHTSAALKLAYKLAGQTWKKEFEAQIEYLKASTAMDSAKDSPAKGRKLRAKLIEQITGVKPVSKAQLNRDAKKRAMSLFE